MHPTQGQRRRIVLLAGALALACWCGLVTPLQAQQSAGRGTGTVIDGATSTPIENVQVSVEGSGIGAVTGQRGTFSLANVPAGARTLVFTILGYDTTRESVTVATGQTATVSVSLTQGFVELGAVTVVGASRTPTRIVEAPAAVSIVTPEQLQREAAHGQLPRLFADQPGVDVVQNGVQDFNINTRGFNSSLNRRVLVLQDGVDRSIGFLQSQEWTALSMPLEDLGRLELVRGPGSALYGANAFSGVINITTPAPADIVGTKVAVSGGQLKSGRLDLRHAGETGSGRWGYKGNVGYVSVGSPFSTSRTSAQAKPCTPAAPPRQACFEYGPLPVEAVPINADPDSDGFFNEAAVSSLYGSGRVDYNFASGAVGSVEAGTTHTENEIFVTGIGRVQVNGANRPWARTEFASRRWVVNGWYSGRRTDEETDRNADGTFDGNNQTALASGAQLREKSNIFHLEAQTNWSFFDDRFHLVGGASNRWTEVDTDGTLMADKHDDTVSSLFGQVEAQLHPIVKALVAARYDHFTVIDSDEISPKAALVFTPSNDHSFRVTYNKAFQTPNYSELFLRVPAGAPVNLQALELGIEAAIRAQTGLTIDLPLNFSTTTPILALGNDDLKVEELTGYEIGHKGSWANGRVYSTVDLYYNEIQDFVTDLLPRVNPDFPAYALPAAFGTGAPLAPFAPTVQGALQQNLGANFPLFSNVPGIGPAFVVSYTNAGEVTEKGAELGLTLLPLANWELNVNGTLFDFEVKEGTAQAGDRLLPNTPKKKANFGVVYSQPRGFNGGVKVHWQEGFDWAAGVFNGHVPGFTLVDLNAGYQVTDYAQINLVWTNVTDKEHYQLYGGSILGSRALGGVTLTF
ncbi:MAG: TonB-dependent receptor domain-containing protein [Gemmatimonadota bacterium]